VAIHFVGLSKNTFREASSRGPMQRISYSPFPADLSIGPVSQHFSYEVLPGRVSDVVIESVEPLAHLRREFEIDNLRLSDFEVRLTPLPIH
jgi:hypothetical protein